MAKRLTQDSVRAVFEKQGLYYPDLFIPRINMIIEVKSDRWYYEHEQRNQLKKHAVRSAGYNFKFMVFNGKHQLLKQEEYETV